jgi:hypothetical protein
LSSGIQNVILNDPTSLFETKNLSWREKVGGRIPYRHSMIHLPSSTKTHDSVIILLNGIPLEFFPMDAISAKCPYFSDPVLSRCLIITDADLDAETVHYFFSLFLNETLLSRIPADIHFRRRLLERSSLLHGFELLEFYLKERPINTYPILTSTCLPGDARFLDASACFIAPLFDRDFDRFNQFFTIFHSERVRLLFQ